MIAYLLVLWFAGCFPMALYGRPYVDIVQDDEPAVALSWIVNIAAWPVTLALLLASIAVEDGDG